MFRLHKELKSVVLKSSNKTSFLSKGFGYLDGQAIYHIYKSSFAPTPHKPFRYIAHILKKGDTYIDIGASYGQMIQVAQIAVGKKGHVIGFEPQVQIYQRLLRMKLAFGWENVTLVCSLVGDAVGKKIMYENANSRVSSIFADWEGGNEIEHPMTTLDKWTQQQQIKNAKLIKIDVEGAELMVLKGGRQFLRDQKPVVLMEINNRSYRKTILNYTIDDLIEFLRKIDYQNFFVLRGDGLHQITSEDDLVDTDQDLLATVSTSILAPGLLNE